MPFLRRGRRKREKEMHFLRSGRRKRKREDEGMKYMEGKLKQVKGTFEKGKKNKRKKKTQE